MALLGINARIGSGKDLVARMIQRIDKMQAADKGLISPSYVPTLKNISTDDMPVYGSNWQVKKFAGNLKLIASILTGVHIDKFEDQDFKKNYVVNLLSLEVRKKEHVGYYYDSEGRDLVSANINSKNPDYDIWITIRLLLQLLGTDIVRKWIPNVWVNSLLANYLPVRTKTADEEYTNDYPNWVISDERFPNEFDGVKSKGGFNVRIFKADQTLNDLSLHASETALDNHFIAGRFDWVLDNNGTLEELERQVVKMMLHFKLI